jgi:hypothetical protein
MHKQECQQAGRLRNSTLLILTMLRRTRFNTSLASFIPAPPLDISSVK